jgi:mannose-6-phosphate isomerase-like protein (cupin superfamily)
MFGVEYEGFRANLPRGCRDDAPRAAAKASPKFVHRVQQYGEGNVMADAVKDASLLYEVERRAQYGARPGFRITELQISSSQKVPWHYHNNIQDTFYVIEGTLRIFLQEPKEEVRLTRGQTYAVPPKRPHLVTNGGDTSAVFLVLQGIGEYDFVPLT